MNNWFDSNFIANHGEEIRINQSLLTFNRLYKIKQLEILRSLYMMYISIILEYKKYILGCVQFLQKNKNVCI